MATTKIDTVTVKTLAVNFPEEFSKPGSFEELHNLRYMGGGVENVSNFTQWVTITDFNNFKILYIHKDNYIAIDQDYAIHHVTIVDKKLISSYVIVDKIDADDTPRLSHYGNVLYITLTSGQLQYSLADGIYSRLYIDMIKPIDDVKFEYEFFTTERYSTLIPGVPILGYNSSIDKNEEYSLGVSELQDQGYIYGLVYVMFAYRLFDGSIVKNSKAYMVETEVSDDMELLLVIRYIDGKMVDGDSYDYMYTQKLSASKPTVTITIDNDIIDTDYIKSVVVFATRPVDIYDFSNYHTIFETLSDSDDDIDGESILAHNFRVDGIEESIKRPFYEVDEFELSEVEGNTISFDLTYSNHFDDIEYDTVYEATFSAHDTQHLEMFEYNSRLHTYDQRITFCETTLPLYSDDIYKEGTINIYRCQLPDGYKIEYYVELSIDDETIETGGGYSEYIYSDSWVIGSGSKFWLPMNNFISYQDYRAQNINIYYSHGGERMFITNIPLTSALSNNLAYYTYSSDEMISTTHLLTVASPLEFVATHTTNPGAVVVEQKNKVMVSVINNPFAYEPVNTYQIGDTETIIYKLATAADEITENSYGQHPLIVFTSSGIYAIAQGSGDTLYSSVVLIDNKAIPNDVESLSISGYIIYTAFDKVYALTSRTTTSISDSITISLDRENDKFEQLADYILGSTLYSLTWYNEVLLYNESYDYAYVYSLKDSAWYTRSLTGYRLSAIKIVNSSGIIDLSVREDTTSSLSPSLITNAFCFNNSSLAKLEHFMPNYKLTKNGYISIAIDVSNDNITWYRVANCGQQRKLGRLSSSWKYFKISIDCNGIGGSSIYFILASFEFKYTLKYLGIVD